MALLVVCAVVATGGEASGKKKKKKKDQLKIGIQWDPTGNQQEGAVWLDYLMARANFVSDHEADYALLQPGPLIPQFAEEVEARRTAVQIYGELVEGDSETSVPYFDELSLVEDAGVMEEYVWIVLRRESWQIEPEGLRLGEFEPWRLERIPAHQPQTKGELTLE